jgi:hippurate hydrolase
MSLIPRIVELQPELSSIRRDIHAHPELGFEESRTSDLVAARLAALGCEVHRGIAKTGLVGTLRCGNANRSIGLRADMDALPIQESNDFAHRSIHEGKMHACGHDGHTAMLLGAAQYLAETRNFEGAVHFIFQPAEEGKGGGRVMVEEGLFDRFPCDAVFALHNKPGLPLGQIATRPGPLYAASDYWDIRIEGLGSHAAHPHLSRDPFVIGSEIVLAIQTIVSRNLNPVESAVVTIGFMNGGSAYNVIPGAVNIGGTARSFRPEVRDLIERRLDELARGVAAAHGSAATLDYRRGSPPTINHEAEVAFAAEVAAEICDRDNVSINHVASMGAEDFSFMLNVRPGAMLWLGNGPSAGVHSRDYDFNDEALPIGASFFARLAERFLGRTD